MPANLREGVGLYRSVPFGGFVPRAGPGNGWGRCVVRRRSATVGVVAALLSTCTSLAVAAPGPTAACRPGDPLANVWGPSRLRVLSSCVTVHGVIGASSRQSDGDFHVAMRLDSGGSIRLEVVPADQPGCTAGQPVRYGICTGAHVAVPAPGTAASVTGAKVVDQGDGGVEIHPVWRITPDGSPPAAATPAAPAPPPQTPPAPPAGSLGRYHHRNRSASGAGRQRHPAGGGSWWPGGGWSSWGSGW